MRLREIRRFSEFRYNRGYQLFDYYRIIAAVAQIFYKCERGVHSLQIKYMDNCTSYEGGSLPGMLQAAAEELREMVWVNQGCYISNQGDRHVGDFLLEKYTETIQLYDTAPTNPGRLKGDAGPKEEYRKMLTQEELEMLELYELSNDVNDLERETKAISMFIDEAKDDIDLDALWDLTVSQIWKDADGKPRNAEKISHEKLYQLPTNKNAAGNLPLDPGFGSVKGSKELMVDAAVDLAMTYDRLSPCSTSPKSEVIKKGKKIRQIVLEPQHLYLLGMHFFGKDIKVHGQVVDGDARGLSSLSGGSLKPIMNQVIHIQHYEQKTYEEALDRLQEIGINESDKSEWEYRLNFTSAVSFALYLIWKVRPHKDDNKKFANLLAHQVCPYIQFAGNHCRPVPGRQISGTVFTLFKNCKLHDAGVSVALGKIQDAIEGRDDEVKTQLESHNEWGLTINDLRIASAYVVLGDDYHGPAIAMNTLNEQVDKVLGSLTKSEHVQTFADGETEGAKFLQKQVRRVGNKLFPFRSTGRLLGKVFNGTAQQNPAHMCAALISMAYDAGCNERVNEIARQTYALVKESEGVDELEVNEHLNAYIQRGLVNDAKVPCIHAITALEADNAKAYFEVLTNFEASL